MTIDDLFESRKVFVKNMVQCFSEIETPSTFCIDAGWGYGKTTFLDVLTNELEENDFCVLRYNSWENDYEQDPFSSIFLTILPQINQYLSKEKKLEKVAIDLTCALIAGALAVTKAITSTALPFLPNLIEIGKDSFNYLPTVKEFINGDKANIPDNSPQQKCLNSFKANLLDLSNKIKEYNPQFKKIVLLIDELDRCRPSFAIELLERVKHILNQEGFVFVFALNKKTLESTVKNMYGEVDPDGYLRRFFDYELVLPEPDLYEFSSQLITNIKISEKKKNSLSVFPKMVEHASCSLRDVEKMFKKLLLTLRIIPDESFDECMNFFLPFCIITMNQDTEWNKDFFTDPNAFENKIRNYSKSACLISIQGNLSSKLQKPNQKIKFKGGILSLFSEYTTNDSPDSSALVDFYYKELRLFSFTIPTYTRNQVNSIRLESYTLKLDSANFNQYRNILMYVYQQVNSISTTKIIQE